MQVGWNQAEQFVAIAVQEEMQRSGVGRHLMIGERTGLRLGTRDDEMQALPMRMHGRMKKSVAILCRIVVWRHKAGEQRDQIKHHKNHAARERNPAAAEPLPEQL